MNGSKVKKALTRKLDELERASDSIEDSFWRRILGADAAVDVRLDGAVKHFEKLEARIRKAGQLVSKLSQKKLGASHAEP